MVERVASAEKVKVGVFETGKLSLILQQPGELRAEELFLNAIGEKGAQGLWFCTRNPERLKEDYKDFPANVQTVWISELVKGEDIVGPGTTENLMNKLESFTRDVKEAGGNPVIFFDAAAKVSGRNGFESFYNGFFAKLVDHCEKEKVALVMSVFSDSFDSAQLNLIRERGVTIEPSIREHVQGKMAREAVKRGMVTLIEEKWINEGTRLFKEAANDANVVGLMVTRTHPDRLLDRIDLKNVKVLWAVEKTTLECKTPVIDSVQPTNYARFSNHLVKEMESNPGTAVIFLGDFLNTNFSESTFDGFVNFLNFLKAHAETYNVALIISFNPGMFTERQEMIIRGLVPSE